MPALALLAGERGLAAVTVSGYVREAGRFLGWLAGGLEELTAAGVTRYVVAGCAGRGPGSAKHLVAGLRSVLRYLHLRGLVPAGLDGAVPAVAGWRGSGLPRALPAGQVAALLGSSDRGTVLARLGLRAGEVAPLEPDDVGWPSPQRPEQLVGTQIDMICAPQLMSVEGRCGCA